MMTIAVHVVFAGSIFLQAAAGPSIQSSVEHGILIVRHGGPAERLAVTISGKPVQSIPDASRTEAVKTLNELADLGFITIRAIPTVARPPWAYKPKTYHGYHPKPEWTYHGRAGWRYDDAKGWHYRREPDWAQRPGAVGQLLTQLPNSGETWYVTRWK